jgi:CheY-like chemotaxis protein
MNTLPLVSFPSMVALIDDDLLFLEAMTGLLKQNYNLTKLNNPAEALVYFKNYKPLLSSLKILRGCTELESYDVSGHLPVDLDFITLKKLRQHTERSNEISVIIVDYNMPEISGIELCRRLQSFPFKKILLTGEADDQLAIDAFNERVIDCFIRKDSPSLEYDIQFHLNVLTQQYFSHNTKQILKHIETDNLVPASDPAFVTFFKEWCDTHYINEFYLIDQSGNFLLIDKDQKKTYFITHTDRTLNNFIELHEDNSEAKKYVAAVKLGKKIPFFGEDKESWNVDPSEWTPYFHAPRILTGRERYYWTVVSP